MGVLQVAITGDKIATVLKAANIDFEPFWPGLFAKALEGVDVKVSFLLRLFGRMKLTKCFLNLLVRIGKKNMLCGIVLAMMTKQRFTQKKDGSFLPN